MSAEQIRDLIAPMSAEDKQRARAIFERRFPNVTRLTELDDQALGRYWHEVSTTQGATSAA